MRRRCHLGTRGLCVCGMGILGLLYLGILLKQEYHYYRLTQGLEHSVKVAKQQRINEDKHDQDNSIDQSEVSEMPIDDVPAKENIYLESLFQSVVQKIMSPDLTETSDGYAVIPNLLTSGIQKDEMSHITVCTQSSLNNLIYLVSLSKRWAGPISVAVFTYDIQITNVIHGILSLRYCHKSIQDRVTFHLVLPSSNQQLNFTRKVNESVGCDSSLLHYEATRYKNFEDTHHPYPQNVLRNVAIKHSSTDYIFMLDIDLSSSKGFPDLQTYISSLERSKHHTYYKTAFVIPVFEAISHYDRIDTKDQVREEIAQGNVRVYYFDMCPHCQRPTNYLRWLSSPMTPTPKILYSVTKQGNYEPFYIARKRFLPTYDQRFIRYGSDRIQQVCETHMSGFEFVVVNNVFIVHDGFKVRDNFHATRNNETNSNKRLYETFKQEMLAKYPYSGRKC